MLTEAPQQAGSRSFVSDRRSICNAMQCTLTSAHSSPIENRLPTMARLEDIQRLHDLHPEHRTFQKSVCKRDIRGKVT